MSVRYIRLGELLVSYYPPAPPRDMSLIMFQLHPQVRTSNRRQVLLQPTHYECPYTAARYASPPNLRAKKSYIGGDLGVKFRRLPWKMWDSELRYMYCGELSHRVVKKPTSEDLREALLWVTSPKR